MLKKKNWINQGAWESLDEQHAFLLLWVLEKKKKTIKAA